MIDTSPLAGKTVWIAGRSGLIGGGIDQALAGVSGITVGDPHLTISDPDVIIHAAGYAQPAKFTADPVATIRVNTAATMELLARLKPGGKFLFLSSSEVYSGCDNAPFSEEDIGTTNPQHPRACYIEGKRCGEAIVHAYRKNSVDAKIVRLSSVYGPGTKKYDERALNVFIQQAITNKKIEMLDAGDAARQFCYVDDAVEMLLNVLLHGKQTVYNVGGGERASMMGIACMIMEICGPEGAIRPGMWKSNGMPGAPDYVCVGISRYETEFGAREFVPLRTGLERTIEYQRKLYG